MPEKKKGKILIVDDNIGVLNSLKFALKYIFEEVITIKNPNQIPHLINSESFDIIILDMNFTAGVNSGNEGIFWLKEILKADTNAVVIMITAYGDVDIAVKAIKNGATDFIQKPFEKDKLITTLQSALKLSQSIKEVSKLKIKQKILSEDISRNYKLFIGSSENMRNVISTINKVAKTDANILILGENGTGKELVAREIHKQSKRSNEVFVSVDMASVSESLFESELFGHIKGAFTDAKENRIGRFEAASGGSLFLDEIANLTMSLQSKILSVLQNLEITPVGSSKPIPIDIRLISATNKDIEQMVKNDMFREDLLYRINTIIINIPPLRERGEDIILLAQHFLEIYSRKYEKPLLKFNGKAIHQLMKYSWPGNVRELQHTIEKTVIMCESNIIGPADFQLSENKKTEIQTSVNLNLEEVEKNTISVALEKNFGNIARTSRELGITRITLYKKIKKYDL
ncbi:sigma-54-dependent transcriptional regulator [Bacteroidota bacterium]